MLKLLGFCFSRKKILKNTTVVEFLRKNPALFSNRVPAQHVDGTVKDLQKKYPQFFLKAPSGSDVYLDKFNTQKTMYKNAKIFMNRLLHDDNEIHQVYKLDHHWDIEKEEPKQDLKLPKKRKKKVTLFSEKLIWKE